MFELINIAGILTAPFFNTQDEKHSLAFIFLSSLCIAASCSCVTFCLFASIYRFERIASVYRGTFRYKVLQFIRVTNAVLAIISIILTIILNIGFGSGYYTILLDVYKVITGLSGIFLMSLDLFLGVRMTVLVLDSVPKDKISPMLKPKLLAILGIIISADSFSIILLVIGGTEAGVTAL